MRLQRIHLAIINEVNKTGQITAAANNLCLTQSALSHSIAKLERAIGTPIWHRQGRALIPTQAGQYLLALASRVLPQLEQGEQRLNEIAKGNRGWLKIGMECHPCYKWLLKQTAPYLAKYEKVDIDVFQKFQFGAIGALFAFEIDILVTPDPIYRPELYYEAVFDYEQVLVLSTKNILSSKDIIFPQDLLNEVLITYPVDESRLDIFNQFLSPAKITPRAHKKVENTEMLLQLVANNRGVTAMPKWLAKEYMGQLNICYKSLGKNKIYKKIYLGARKDDLNIDYINGFFKMCRQE